MKRKFTILEMFNIVDGRISTSFIDVIDIMKIYTKDNFVTTTGAQIIMQNIIKKKPKWFIDATNDINAIKLKIKTNNFNTLIKELKKSNKTYIIN